MCGPHRRFAPLLPRTLLRIPQTVGAVATIGAFYQPNENILLFQYRKR